MKREMAYTLPGKFENTSQKASSEKILQEVQRAMDASIQKLTTVEHAILSYWGCSNYHQLDKKLEELYGKPDESQLFNARLALKDCFNQQESISQIPGSTRPFVVTNPI